MEKQLLQKKSVSQLMGDLGYPHWTEKPAPPGREPAVFHKQLRDYINEFVSRGETIAVNERGSSGSIACAREFCEARGEAIWPSSGELKGPLWPQDREQIITTVAWLFAWKVYKINQKGQKWPIKPSASAQMSQISEEMSAMEPWISGSAYPIRFPPAWLQSDSPWPSTAINYFHFLVHNNGMYYDQNIQDLTLIENLRVFVMLPLIKGTTLEECTSNIADSQRLETRFTEQLIQTGIDLHAKNLLEKNNEGVLVRSKNFDEAWRKRFEPRPSRGQFKRKHDREDITNSSQNRSKMQKLRQIYWQSTDNEQMSNKPSHISPTSATLAQQMNEIMVGVLCTQAQQDEFFNEVNNYLEQFYLGYRKLRNEAVWKTEDIARVGSDGIEEMTIAWSQERKPPFDRKTLQDRRGALVSYAQCFLQKTFFEASRINMQNLSEKDLGVPSPDATRSSLPSSMPPGGNRESSEELDARPSPPHPQRVGRSFPFSPNVSQSDPKTPQEPETDDDPIERYQPSKCCPSSLSEWPWKGAKLHMRACWRRCGYCGTYYCELKALRRHLLLTSIHRDQKIQVVEEGPFLAAAKKNSKNGGNTTQNPNKPSRENAAAVSNTEASSNMSSRLRPRAPQREEEVADPVSQSAAPPAFQQASQATPQNTKTSSNTPRISILVKDKNGKIIWDAPLPSSQLRKSTVQEFFKIYADKSGWNLSPLTALTFNFIFAPPNSIRIERGDSVSWETLKTRTGTLFTMTRIEQPSREEFHIVVGGVGTDNLKDTTHNYSDEW